MRKEVSYVIENGSDPSSVISGIWNRLSQVKEQGEAYAEKAKNTQSSGPNGKPPPYRSTLVVVCPNCEEIGDFPLFDDVVEVRWTGRGAGAKRQQKHHNAFLHS